VSAGPRADRPRHSAWPALRWARRVTQGVALALFTYLLFAAVQSRHAAPGGNVFLRFDPLASFVTMLSSRTWLPGLALAVVTLIVTLVAGRVWCGWICPLGTIVGTVRFKGARRQASRLPPRLRLTKYVLLVALVAMAACGVMTLMVLDPIGLLTRTATTAFIPGLDYIVTGLESAMQRVGALQGIVNALEAHLRGPVLPVVQPHYAQAVFLGLLLALLLAANALADRFWCRHLCPLGALLGLLSKVSLLRPVVGASCDSCGRCAGACRLGAIASAGAGDERSTQVVSSECTVCLDCLVACPGEPGMSFALGLRPGPWQAYDPGRRDFLVAAAAGLGGVALLGAGVWNLRRDPRLIRPPGVTDEGNFLARCLRCGECLKVCPTSGLQPSLGQAGLTGLWTPVLTPRLGYCLYDCRACGPACPSGAIPSLALAVKQKQVIGTATIDRNRCLPWARGVPCSVCQEVCPLPHKAVTLTDGVMIKNGQGGTNWMTRPVVLAERCIGCGTCEYQCPLEGVAAIRVERPSGIAPGAVAAG
jgi:MauM/NapG family ferredoxin protein